MPKVEAVQMSQEEVEAMIASVPGMLTGDIPDKYGIAEKVMKRLSAAAFKSLLESFEAKSAGGSDAAGQKWAPLAASTQTRKGPVQPKFLQMRHRLQHLTVKQQSRVKRVFKAHRAALTKAGVPLARSDALAKALAFNRARREYGQKAFPGGVRQLIETRAAISNKVNHPILVETEQIKQAFTDKPFSVSDKVDERIKGGVRVGVNPQNKRGYFHAAFHQSGTKRMPRRKVVWEDADVPASEGKKWAKEASEALTEAIVEAIR